MKYRVDIRNEMWGLDVVSWEDLNEHLSTAADLLKRVTTAIDVTVTACFTAESEWRELLVAVQEDAKRKRLGLNAHGRLDVMVFEDAENHLSILHEFVIDRNGITDVTEQRAMHRAENIARARGKLAAGSLTGAAS